MQKSISKIFGLLILLGLCACKFEFQKSPGSVSSSSSLNSELAVDTEPVFTTPAPTNDWPTPPASTNSKGPATGNPIHVVANDSASLVAALKNARAGDMVVIAPGTYMIATSVGLIAQGTPTSPIWVTAPSLGSVIIKSKTTEMINVNAANWNFENLLIQGDCVPDSACEHAFHVVEKASGFMLRNSILRDFNAMIKGNGQNGTYPSNVLIENNQFYNRWGRDVGVLTFIDVVGGDYWTLRGNYIADFQKAGGNFISYGAFLKGGSRYGLFENNFVVCSRYLPYAGDARLGLSFGGGGTGPQFCDRGEQCETGEHIQGIMRNNILMNCSDAGIFMRKAVDCKLHNNILYNTIGIDEVDGTSGTEALYNIAYNTDNTFIYDRASTHNNAMDAKNFSTNSKPAILALFTNPDSGDFSLKGTNTKGTSSISGFTKDMCGFTRTAATPEYGPIEFSTSDAAATTESCASKQKKIFDSHKAPAL
jgi:hypothetical protein